MSCAVTRKGNMSRVVPGLWWWDQINCQIWGTIIAGSMVVVAVSSHRGSPSLITRRGQISSRVNPRL